MKVMSACSSFQRRNAWLTSGIRNVLVVTVTAKVVVIRFPAEKFSLQIWCSGPQAQFASPSSYAQLLGTNETPPGRASERTTFCAAPPVFTATTV